MKRLRRILQAIFFWINIAWIKLLVLITVSKQVEGKENIPAKGPAILVCNHMNNTDPPIILSVLSRRSKWFVKKEWFRNPIIGFLARAGGLMPVDRYRADISALRKGQAVLRDGLILGVYPEGTRSLTQMLSTGEPGAALLALRTGVPVLPIAIWGTENMKLSRDIFRRTLGIHVRIGEPFHLIRSGSKIERSEIEAGTVTVMESIKRLLPEKYHGVYAEGVREKAVQ